MGWFSGNWFGGSSSGGGGGIVFPPLTNVTTAESIRDRIIQLIAELVPNTRALPENRYRPYLNEHGADFYAACAMNPTVRWFQVRDTGDDRPPEVSNTDVEERM